MAKDANISNIWRHLKFICGAPTEDGICGQEMAPEMAVRQLVFKCPKCGEMIPYFDTEKFINKATNIIVDDAEDGIETNLTNFKMKMISRIDKKQHTFTVLLHTQDKLKVSIKNN